MTRSGGRLLVAMMAMVALTACGSSGSSGSGGSTTSAAGASASASTSEDIGKLTAFAEAIGPLQLDYTTTAQDYKKAVLGKDLKSAIADAEKLDGICAKEARLDTSGDDVVDTEWPAFASDCQTGWALILQGYQKKDATLIKQAHTYFDSANTHLLAVSKQLISLGQTLKS
jgi:hypothetical protein